MYRATILLLILGSLQFFSLAWASESVDSESVAKLIESIKERLKRLDEADAAAARLQVAAEVVPQASEAAAAPEPRPSSPAPKRDSRKKRAHRAPAEHRSPAGERKLEVMPTGNEVSRPSQEVPPVPESPQEEETRLTRNWGGLRSSLSDHGIDLALIYKAEFNSVFSGGLESKANYLGNIDFRVSVDVEKLVGWKGGSLFFYVLNDHGGHPSESIGDIQVTSNIETAVATTKLYEAWLQQLAFGEKVSFLLGLHDLNSEFYTTDASGLFFNSTFGIGKDLSQTGVNGPSIFPTTSLALRVRAEPSKSFYIQAAAFEAKAGDPLEPRGTQVSLSSHDGLLFISEFAYLRGRDPASHELYGKYGIGAWAYTRTFDHLSDTLVDADGATVPAQAVSSGLYFLGEQALTEGASLFLRYGATAGEANEVSFCLGAGVVFTGLLPHRDKDRLGLGVARVGAGSALKAAQASAGEPIRDDETTFEANYRFEAMPGIALQPDLQYVVHPSFSAQVPNAWVGAFRMELSF